MPRYRNSTNADIVVGSYRFPAEDILEIRTFIETIPAGLALESVDPQYEDVLYSEKHHHVTGVDLATIAVPDNPDGTDYRIQLYVESGEIQLRFNTADDTPILVVEGETFNRYLTTKAIEDIRIHSVVGGWVWVNVLKG